MNISAARYLAATLSLAVTIAPAVAGTSVPVVDLAAAPEVDGSAADWASVQGTSIELRRTRPDGQSSVESVTVKSGVFGDEVFFLLEWDDATEDDEHKPFVWDADAGKYVTSTKREDRLALQFEMSGDYTTDWLSGNEFTADIWHWKAHRSNTLGLAHDKKTVVSRAPLRRAFEATGRDGASLYIQRPSDAGTRLYKSMRYTSREADEMPKYILAENPEGSVADVTARGVWKDGAWCLEMRRKLDTGHPDDVVFERGAALKGGIAAFDRTGDDDHNVSDTITFMF